MGGRFAARDLDDEVALSVPGAAPVTGRFIKLKIYAADDAPELLALFTLSLSLAAYQRVQDDELFEVSLATTAPEAGQVVFWDTSPIELELALRSPPRADPPDQPEALAALLVARLGSDPVLGAAASYRWWRTLQLQPSRAGASIKAGYRSRFAAESGLP